MNLMTGMMKKINLKYFIKNVPKNKKPEIHTPDIFDKDESYLRSLLKSDSRELHAEPAIRERLEYSLQLKSRNSSLRKNSFLDMILSFFTLQNLGLKAGMVTALFVLTFWFNRSPEQPLSFDKGIHFLADSSYCDTVPDILPNHVNKSN